MKNVIVFILMLLPVLVSAQSKKVWISHADEFFKVEDYHNALINYKNALNDSVGMLTMVLPYEVQISNQKLKNKKDKGDSVLQVPMKSYLNHQIAICYLETADYEKASSVLAESADYKHYPDDAYLYGVTLMNVSNHKEAVEVFSDYIASDNSNDSLLRAAQLSVTGCYYAMDESNLLTQASATLSDTSVFNKGAASFAVQYFGNEDRVLFTSARQGGVLLNPEKQNSLDLCDLYYAERNSSGFWQEAKNFGRPLNSAQHDAAGSYSSKSIIYYTRWNDENPKEQHIIMTRMVDFKFYESFTLPNSVNVPGYKSIQPFVSLDGRMLYFSSNRPGGEGGMDLWQIELDENGLPVGEAKNLGRPVNSELDEVTPFFHEASSTLFFSSNGHNSIGGLDVFKAKFDKETKVLRRPENMGIPINSTKDDSYMVWDKFLKHGFVSSDREDCENGNCFNIYEVTNEPIEIVLEGYVYDAETNEIIPGSEIHFKDVGFVLDDIKLIADNNGYYSLELEPQQEWFIKAQHPSYFADGASINTKSITTSTTLKQDFYLNSIPKDEIELDGIEYDFNSANLRPRSKEILDELYDFLMLNDNLVVEIKAHTDERGSHAYNLDLSERRAKSCVDYLISKGIPKERLVAKGYGETDPNFLKDENKKPVLDEDGERIVLTPEYIKAQKGKKYQDELHQKNRRTAFKVIGEGVSIESL